MMDNPECGSLNIDNRIKEVGKTPQTKYITETKESCKDIRQRIEYLGHIALSGCIKNPDSKYLKGMSLSIIILEYRKTKLRLHTDLL